MTAPEVWTIQDVLKWSTEYLAAAMSDSPRLDVELLLSHSLDYQRIDLYTRFDQPLTIEERTNFKKLLKRRVEGEPVAYILGNKEFYGLSFLVNNSVLIPRPDTETLVEAVLKRQNSRKNPQNDKIRVLDVGTGSGCIAVVLAKQLENASIVAWDYSDHALAIAVENARRHEVDVEFKHCNALLESCWQGLDAFDVICSNPPYIEESEKLEMSKSVLEFEPQMALFAEQEGLSFYRCFAQHAWWALKPAGYIALELGYRQAEAVSEIFFAHGWREIELLQDLSKVQRVLVAQRPL